MDFIHCRGIITPIFEHFGVCLSAEETLPQNKLNEQALRVGKIIIQHGGQTFLKCKDDYFSIPNPPVTYESGLSNQANWNMLKQAHNALWIKKSSRAILGAILSP